VQHCQLGKADLDAARPHGVELETLQAGCVALREGDDLGKQGCLVAQHSTAQRSAAQHSAAQHSTAQHSTPML